MFLVDFGGVQDAVTDKPSSTIIGTYGYGNGDGDNNSNFVSLLALSGVILSNAARGTDCAIADRLCPRTKTRSHRVCTSRMPGALRASPCRVPYFRDLFLPGCPT